MCMALAFEGLFDKVLECFVEEEKEANLTLAIFVTFIWVGVCMTVTKVIPQEGEAEG